MFEFREATEWVGWGAGNDGTIWRFRKKHGWIMYRGHRDKKGYILLAFRHEGIYGKKLNTYASRMVVHCFLGHPLKGRSIVVDHLDNNPSNNALNNLRVTNQSDNLKRAASLGRIPGNRNSRTPEIVTLDEYVKCANL